MPEDGYINRAESSEPTHIRFFNTAVEMDKIIFYDEFENNNDSAIKWSQPTVLDVSQSKQDGRIQLNLIDPAAGPWYTLSDTQNTPTPPVGCIWVDKSDSRFGTEVRSTLNCIGKYNLGKVIEQNHGYDLVQLNMDEVEKYAFGQDSIDVVESVKNSLQIERKSPQQVEEQSDLTYNDIKPYMTFELEDGGRQILFYAKLPINDQQEFDPKGKDRAWVPITKDMLDIARISPYQALKDVAKNEHVFFPLKENNSELCFLDGQMIMTTDKPFVPQQNPYDPSKAQPEFSPSEFGQFIKQETTKSAMKDLTEKQDKINEQKRQSQQKFGTLQRPQQGQQQEKPVKENQPSI